MAEGKTNNLRVLVGILGAGVILWSIILFSSKDASEVFRITITTLLQLDLGTLLIIYGINENRMKGKPKGNMYFVVGLAALTSTIYTIYNLYSKLAQ